MKSLQIIAPGRAEWRDTPIPEPGEGEVLIKVLGVTTCPHWDMHLMDGVPMFPGRPLHYPYTPGQPGHEAMGEVVAFGAGVTGFPIGQRVAAWRDAGHQHAGCYAQYAVLSQENLIAIPKDLPPAAIASLELAMCVQVTFDQLAQLDAVRGTRFGVSGLGPAGLVALQLAIAHGVSEVVGIDPLLDRRELARELGADQALAPEDDALLAGRTGPLALDAAIDCTGLKASIEFLMDRTRHIVAIFGVLREDVAFGARHWSGLALLGYGSHNRGAAERALGFVRAGQLRLDPLVTHALPFTRYEEGIALLRARKAIKVLFLPWSKEGLA
jgi:threonine dehydrogenase-like Zn-dependent dehydrogenase